MATVNLDVKSLASLFRSWVIYLGGWLGVLVVLSLGLAVFQLHTANIGGASIPYPWVGGDWQMQLAFLAALYLVKH